MIRKLMYVVVLVPFLLSVQAFATVYDYSVEGEFTAGSVNHYVDGTMSISDEFMLESGSPSGSFGITGFSLLIDGQVDFSGGGGGMWFSQADEQLGGIITSGWSISNSKYEWGAFGSSVIGPMLQPVWADVWFYFDYETGEWQGNGYLGEGITLWGIPEQSDFSLYPGYSDGILNLTRTHAPAPVPEPSVMLLLGSGLLCVFLARCRLRRNAC